MEIKPNKSPEKQAADKLGITVTKLREAKRLARQLRQSALEEHVKALTEAGYDNATVAYLMDVKETSVRRILA